MLNFLIIFLAVILMAGLLHFEKTGHQRVKLPTKTLLSGLFIFAALVQPHPIPGYYHMLLMGLICCLGGDVLLALPGEKMFLAGLVSFLLGHVLYVIGFLNVAAVSYWTGIGGLLGLLISATVFGWLRSHLGTLLIPVIAYIIVITAMLVGAWTVLGDTNLNFSGRLLVFCGAVGFYFSDLFVARERFIKSEFANRLIGLPLYYSGQFLLAFSIGFI